MQTTLSTVPQVTTNRPALFMPGFYALQALSTDDVFPSITQYHRRPEPAVRWMNGMAKKKLFDNFLLSSSYARWDVYDCHGKAIGTRTSIVPESGAFMEVSPVQVDLDEYVNSAKEIIGKDLVCIARAEHHAHASTIRYSNLAVVARDMIVNACDKDLEHIYMVDSVASGCKVLGWFMNAKLVSANLMDQYLDRYEALSNDWPLPNDKFGELMYYRMYTLRPLHILEILKVVNDLVPLGEDIGLVRQRIENLNDRELPTFEGKMLAGMAEMPVKSPQTMEALDKELIAEHAHRIAALYRETFLK